MQMLDGKKIMKKEEVAEVEELEKENAREWQLKMLNTILVTPENSIRFYTKNKKCFDPNLYSERRFEELFTKGEVLKSHDDRNVNKLDAYGRLLHHMISNIITPNIGYKSSITNIHSFVMLSLHEHRKMNFVFQYFVLNLVGVGDCISIGKIYNKHTFKRMGFSRNEEVMLVR
ncbi:hypothetical protein M9H77_18259 [Catharanthus roseus]|uniref:Uncharacterized protein n=1 Tax=Catharanthus roseus TaxID=4058 RepID=A0ACC0B6Z2_CATRO|nr:hypothetical protein M9H77_18259 [Catharanthus roseus]